MDRAIFDLSAVVHSAAQSVVADVGSSVYGAGPLALLGILFAGMILQPVLLLVTMHLRPRNPLSDSGGLVWILAAGMILYGSLMLTGRTELIDQQIVRVLMPAALFS